MQKLNPKPTQDLLRLMKTKGDYLLNVDGIKVKVIRNVFPPKSGISKSSFGLLSEFIDMSNLAVLDMGTGTGIQALEAVKRGAREIVAVDINKEAIKCASENVKINKCEKIVKLYESDLFEALDQRQKFDVIIANLPIIDYPLFGRAEGALYDPHMNVHHRFFSQAKNYLKKNGVIILPHMDMAGKGAFEEIENMIACYDFRIDSSNQEKFGGYCWRVYKLTYKN